MKEKKGIEELAADKQSYDKESQVIIDGIVATRAEMEILKELKRTTGWKLLEKKIREELRETIALLIKDDKKIQTLIGLLKVTDTKSTAKLLNETVDSFLPDEGI